MRYDFSHLTSRELEAIAEYIEKFGIFKVTTDKYPPGVYLIIEITPYADSEVRQHMKSFLPNIGVGTFQGNKYMFSTFQVHSLIPYIFAHVEYAITREVLALAFEYLNLQHPKFHNPNFTSHLPALDWLTYDSGEQRIRECLYWLTDSQGGDVVELGTTLMKRSSKRKMM